MFMCTRHTPLGELGWVHHGDRNGGLLEAYVLAGRLDAVRRPRTGARNPQGAPEPPQPPAVEQHLPGIYNKLGVATRAATHFAVTHGLA